MADNKCAHPLCKCIPPTGQKYCSTYCEDSKDVTTLQCDCGHGSCASAKL
jgi:hypothetical protein